MRAIIAFVLLAASCASGNTLSFDDITTGSSAPIGSYGGLLFSADFSAEKTSANPPFQNAATSGSYAAVATSLFDAHFSGTPFELVSAYFTGSSNGQVLSIGGTLSNFQFINPGATITLTTSPQLVTFDWNNVINIQFSTSDSKAFAMDDLTWSPPTPLPLPSVAICGVALLALLPIRRYLVGRVAG